MKVFLSWSGENSKSVAKALKRALISVFEEVDKFEVFLSEETILSGADWFAEIKKELKKSDCSIICCTPENYKAPWINFEAGAGLMDFEEKHVIPYLVGIQSLENKLPLSNLHCINHSKAGFKKLVCDINEIEKVSNLKKKQLEDCAGVAFDRFLSEKSIKKIVKLYDTKEVIKVDDIYPNDFKMYRKKNVFISSPMASIEDPTEYQKFQKDMKQIQNALKISCKVKNVYYPGENIEGKERFEGKKKAINNNFHKLKECEYLLVVYPKALVTSVLVEIGYAIALSKKIIVFVKNKNDLPYILKEADKSINNLHLYTYNDMKDILYQIESNGTSFLI